MNLVIFRAELARPLISQVGGAWVVAGAALLLAANDVLYEKGISNILIMMNVVSLGRGVEY